MCMKFRKYIPDNKNDEFEKPYITNTNSLYLILLKENTP